MLDEKQSSRGDKTNNSNNAPSSLLSPELRLPPSSRGVAVCAEDISYSYPSRPDVHVIRNLSFKIPPGSFTAFVGSSGTGKSTICRLLSGLLKPATGCVLVGGVNLRYASEEEIRKHVRRIVCCSDKTL